VYSYFKRVTSHLLNVFMAYPSLPSIVDGRWIGEALDEFPTQFLLVNRHITDSTLETIERKDSFLWNCWRDGSRSGSNSLSKRAKIVTGELSGKCHGKVLGRPAP
jgi:hypothetical protein